MPAPVPWRDRLVTGVAAAAIVAWALALATGADAVSIGARAALATVVVVVAGRILGLALSAARPAPGRGDPSHPVVRAR
jgi:hypothetical protein